MMVRPSKRAHLNDEQIKFAGPECLFFIFFSLSLSADGDSIIFPVQLTTSRIDNRRTRLIHTLQKKLWPYINIVQITASIATLLILPVVLPDLPISFRHYALIANLRFLTGSLLLQ